MPDVSITITIPEAAVQRVRAAYTALLGLDSPAMPNDIKSAIIQRMRRQVLQYEEEERAKQAGPDLGDFS